MYTFQVKQKNRSKILSVFHLLIALIFILDLSHVHEHEKRDWVFTTVYLAGCVILFASVALQKKILRSLTRHLSLLLLESALVFCGAIYFWARGASLVAFGHGVLAGVIILFWIYLKRRVNGERIIVSEKSIVVPGLSGDRIIEWSDLSNAVKKYDLLTFDFKNNKLLQVQVTGDENIDENEYNQFCTHQLSRSYTENKSGGADQN